MYAVTAAALPDGTPVIVSAGDDGTVRVWRLTDGTPIGEPLRGHDGAVNAVTAAALPDGTPVIVSAGDDGTVRVWRLTDGTPIGEPLRGHNDAVSAVTPAALPDGTAVIISAGGYDGTVRVWPADRPRTHRKSEGSTGASIGYCYGRGAHRRSDDERNSCYRSTSGSSGGGSPLESSRKPTLHRSNPARWFGARPIAGTAIGASTARSLAYASMIDIVPQGILLWEEL